MNKIWGVEFELEFSFYKLRKGFCVLCKLYDSLEDKSVDNRVIGGVW